MRIEEAPEHEFEDFEEKCLLNLINYKDPEEEKHAPVVEQQLLKATSKASIKDNSKAQNTENTMQTIESARDDLVHFERLSNKLIMVSPTKSSNLVMIVHHQDASFSIKKAIFDRAKSFWKENLADIQLNVMLTFAKDHQEALAERFNQSLIKEDFNLGCQHEDEKIGTITYKTFLKENDPRLRDDYI